MKIINDEICDGIHVSFDLDTIYLNLKKWKVAKQDESDKRLNLVHIYQKKGEKQKC